MKSRLSGNFLHLIPNSLSLSRIFLSFGILIAPDSRILLTVLLLCGLTDILDGFLARKMKCETELGARLDSLGDFVFFVILGVYMLVRQFEIISPYLLLLTVIAAIRLSSLVLCRIRNGKFYSLHTAANKITGLLLFPGIILVLFTPMKKTMIVLTAAALLSALEELIIMIRIKSPDCNIKSLFSIPGAP